MTVVLPRHDLNAAVLFIVFNRPEATAKVFDVIRQVRPKRLYVAADGPRRDRTGEAERSQRVRTIATSVNWPCEVKTLFRPDNLGCKRAVSGAISWFFEHEDRGIILEDDCLPHPKFFEFCEHLLNYYERNDKVWVITGDNFQRGRIRGSASYYFSKFNHVWGWATWRRAWAKADMALSFWPQWRDSDEFDRWIPDRSERRYWKKIFDRAYFNAVDTWDYHWTACVWYGGGLTATPNYNLVKNIGFGPDATHTVREVETPEIDTSVENSSLICHPTNVERDIEADKYAYYLHFGGKDRGFPGWLLSLPRRIVGTLKHLIK